MITCPECNNQELEGSIFCTNCGVLLQDGEGDSRTATLPFGDDYSADRAAPPLVGKKSGTVNGAVAIRFVIPVSGRKITLPIQDQIRIGRDDPKRGSHPELDLAEDGGTDAGISRLHAVILTTAQGIAIMDLNSVNGTRVNNYRIPPHLPFALNDGDELKLGDLLIHVFFEG